ncbi:MAG: transglutaminase-like domain-containing protein [Thermoanaerobaculia bacterium]
MVAGVALSLAAWLAGGATVETAGIPATRRFEGTYVATVDSVPAGLSRLEVWVPLPRDTPDQKIGDLKVDSPYPGSLRREREHGNSYFYFSTENPWPGPLEIRVHFRAVRNQVRGGAAARSAGAVERPEELRRFLEPEKYVTLSPRVRALARQVTLGHATPEARARAIYDYIVNTMTYDKTAPGWGQGDTERACDVLTGNCTDFHSLFLSLARADGIPARFVIGFPLMPEPRGSVPGYHCWAEFYLPGKGWIPVDASDASKSDDPPRRDYLFGNLDPDRIEFTTGRDLRLDPPPCSKTLNYFIYPYAEGDGASLAPVAIRLDYQDEPAGAAAVAGGAVGR